METKKLSAFIETIEIGSINKAAESIGYTQSGLSYMLNKLEDELGVKLLKRSHAGIMLTPEGEELFPVIREITEKEKEMEQKLERIKRRECEVIRIGTYSGLMISWLPAIINRYKERHPSVRFEIHTGFNQLNDLLEEDKVDIVFCEQHLVDRNSDHKWEFLFEDEMCIAIHDSLPLAKEETIKLEMLKGYPVMYPVVNHKNIVALKLKQLGITFENKTEIYTDDGSITLSMVDKNKGISFLSGLYQAECPQHVCMKSVSPKLYRQIGVAVNEKKAQPRAVPQFLKCIKKHKTVLATELKK